jgi:hypothetical protein
VLERSTSCVRKREVPPWNHDLLDLDFELDLRVRERERERERIGSGPREIVWRTRFEVAS